MIKKVLLYNASADDLAYLYTQLKELGYEHSDVAIYNADTGLPVLPLSGLEIILVNIDAYDLAALNVVAQLKHIYKTVAMIGIVPATNDAYIPAKIIHDGIDNYLLNGLFTPEMLNATIKNAAFQKQMIVDCAKTQQDLLILETNYNKEKNLLNTILSSMEEVIWAVDTNTFELLYISHACKHIYGYTADEMIADEKIFLNAIYHDDLESFVNSFKEMHHTGELRTEFQVVHKDGSIKTLKIHATVKYDEGQHPVLCTGITTDITELRKTEVILKEKVDEIETILGSITDAFYSLDREGFVTYVNKESEILLGLNKNQIIGRKLWEFFPNNSGMGFHNQYIQALSENISVKFEQYVPVMDKWFTIHIYPNKDGVVVYNTDITESKRQAAFIKEQDDKLKEIAWIQSHKIRGPIATIKGLTSLFDHENPSNPANTEVLRKFELLSDDIDNMIREINGKTCCNKQAVQV